MALSVLSNAKLDAVAYEMGSLSRTLRAELRSVL